jgi:hypothetical protein
VESSGRKATSIGRRFVILTSTTFKIRKVTRVTIEVRVKASGLLLALAAAAAGSIAFGPTSAYASGQGPGTRAATTTTTLPSPSPDLPVCSPPAGTVVSSTATSDYTSWMPTNVSSSFLAGPGTISRSYSSASTVGASVSASFGVDESLLFASAKETYGLTVTGSVTHTGTWTYTETVPAGVTAKVQQYHEGAELGIKQVSEVYISSSKCGTNTQTSPSGNYFPYSSTADASYCYALTSSSSPGIQVRSLCTSTD